jgi:2-phospho-L-lactate transferase/gluconeogenesis factor (CofD/UPF0052 family)
MFVCNVATQSGETEGMDLAGHVDALVRHTAPGIVDIVVANNRFDAAPPPLWHAEGVRLHWPPTTMPRPHLVLDDVVDPENAHRHDPERLAASVLRAFEGETAAHRRSSIRSA